MLQIVLITINLLNHTNIDYESVSSIEVEHQYQIFEVTAYTEGFESTGKRPGDKGYGEVAASGTAYANFEPLFVKEHHTIACPPSMPFGTQIFIPYLDNTFTCEDRGGAIKEGKLDVYMPLVKEALKFGRRELEVLVLEEVEDEKMGGQAISQKHESWERVVW